MAGEVMLSMLTTGTGRIAKVADGEACAVLPGRLVGHDPGRVKRAATQALTGAACGCSRR